MKSLTLWRAHPSPLASAAASAVLALVRLRLTRLWHPDLAKQQCELTVAGRIPSQVCADSIDLRMADKSDAGNSLRPFSGGCDLRAGLDRGLGSIPG